MTYGKPERTRLSPVSKGFIAGAVFGMVLGAYAVMAFVMMATTP